MNTAVTQPSGAWISRLLVAVFLLVGCAHVLCCLQGWYNLPVDGHEFRQTQTALSIRYLMQDGLRLDYETPLLGKPWAVPLEFPLYQGAVAVVARATSLPLVQAGRLVGILAFYLSLPPVFLLLARLHIPRARRLVLLILLLSSPLYLFYTRAIMIESTAFCLGAWFLWGFWALVAEGRQGPGLLALGFGALGAMVKLPALAGWLTAAAFILGHSIWTGRNAVGTDRRGLFLRWAMAALVLIGVVAAGLAWSAHTDALKALNPLADLLRSGAVARWGMGPLSLRFSLAFWGELWRITTTSVLTPVGLLAFGLLFLRGPRGRLPVLALLVCVLGSPLVFATLYRFHDYYSYSTGIFLLGAVALALERGFSRAGWTPAATLLLLVVTAGLDFRSYGRAYHPMIGGNAQYDNPLGQAIRAVTAPSDVIVIYGQDWNPLTPYFAERRALMFPGRTAEDEGKTEQAFANLAGERVAAVVITGPERLNTGFVQLATARFGLAPEPVLQGQGTSLFVRATGRRAAAAILRPLGLREFQVPEVSEASGPAASGPPQAVANLPAADQALFRSMKPVPHTIQSQFGFGPARLDDQLVFGAHPTTELTFDPPTGARRLRATFGILPGAYADILNATDGVDFTVLARHADGTATRIIHRWLQPAAQADDRGVQKFDIALPETAGDQIILRTTPGPAGNLSYDWAFWGTVSIE